MTLTELPRPVIQDTAILTQYMTPGDDADTNRTGLQSLLDRIAPSGLGKGAKLFIPPRWDVNGAPDPIVVNRNGANAWALDVPSDTTIEGGGVGSSLQLAASQANSTRLLRVQDKERVTIRNVRLDGNRVNNASTYEHNHCIFVYDSSDVVIEDVVTTEATGDGVSISGSTTKSARVWVNRLNTSNNTRNGVTVEQADDVWITNSIIDMPSDATGQCIDSEPFESVITNRLTISGNRLINRRATPGYILTLSGRSSTYPRRQVLVTGNTFEGGGIIHVLNDEGVAITDNHGTISYIYGQAYSDQVRVSGNHFAIESTASQGVYLAYSLSDYPRRWTIADNHLVLTGSTDGIYLRGCDDVVIRGGIIEGDGTSDSVAVAGQATRDMRNISITGTMIRNVGKAVSLAQYLTYTLSGLTLGGLTVDTTTNTGAAIDLQSAAAWLSNVTILPNTIRNTTGRQFDISTSTPYVTAGTPGERATWSVNGTPEGVITERVGAMALRRDGGAGTTLYVKESGNGTNTGWRAV